MSYHRPTRHVRRRRYGFTLVELLVVITIIGMLMALLLPAVNAAVEAGRNVQCKNNLGQLAKAVNVYQNREEQFPGYENQLTQDRVVSWVVEIFPDLDRLDLYADWSDPAITNSVLSNDQYMPYMELLICPSDPPEQIGGPKLSYVANSGFAGNPDASGNVNVETLPDNGIFLPVGKKSNIDAIKDGPSYTLLFSENIQAQRSPNGWHGFTAGIYRNTTTFVWHTNACTNCKINANKTTAPADNIETARPSSFHSGGVNVAFADTHVIFLKEEIAYPVYRQLMTPNHRKSDAPQTDKILNEADFK